MLADVYGLAERSAFADFSEFLKVIQTQKSKVASQDEENDTGRVPYHLSPPLEPLSERTQLASANYFITVAAKLVPSSRSHVCCLKSLYDKLRHIRLRAVDAFIALGGHADKTGEISTDKLRAIVKAFDLTIDIEVLFAVSVGLRYVRGS